MKALRFGKRQFKPVYDKNGRRLGAVELVELTDGAWEYDRTPDETVRVEAGNRALREARGGEG